MATISHLETSMEERLQALRSQKGFTREAQGVETERWRAGKEPPPPRAMEPRSLAFLVSPAAGSKPKQV